MPTHSYGTVVVALIIVFFHLRRTKFYLSTLFDCETESRREMLDVLVLSSGLSGCTVLFSISKVQTCSPAAWSQWIRPTRGSSSCVCLCLGFFSNLIIGNLGLEFVVWRMWDECDLQASQVQFDRRSERIISILLGSPSSCSFSGPTGPLLLIWPSSQIRVDQQICFGFRPEQFHLWKKNTLTSLMATGSKGGKCLVWWAIRWIRIP